MVINFMSRLVTGNSGFARSGTVEYWFLGGLEPPLGTKPHQFCK